MLARNDAIETVAQHAMSMKVRSTGCRSREPLQQPLRLVPANRETSTRQPCCCLGATTAFSAHPSRAMRSRETTIKTLMSAHGGQHTVMTREPAEGGSWYSSQSLSSVQVFSDTAHSCVCGVLPAASKSSRADARPLFEMHGRLSRSGCCSKTNVVQWSIFLPGDSV